MGFAGDLVSTFSRCQFCLSPRSARRCASGWFIGVGTAELWRALAVSMLCCLSSRGSTTWVNRVSSAQNASAGSLRQRCNGCSRSSLR